MVKASSSLLVPAFGIEPSTPSARATTVRAAYVRETEANENRC